jgi:hypothetical protein
VPRKAQHLQLAQPLHHRQEGGIRQLGAGAEGQLAQARAAACDGQRGGGGQPAAVAGFRVAQAQADQLGPQDRHHRRHVLVAHAKVGLAPDSPNAGCGGRVLAIAALLGGHEGLQVGGHLSTRVWSGGKCVAARWIGMRGSTGNSRNSSCKCCACCALVVCRSCTAPVANS